MAIVKRIRKIREKVQVIKGQVGTQEDIQALKEMGRRGVEKFGSEEFQKELALRTRVGSPLEVKAPKRPKKKPRKVAKPTKLPVTKPKPSPKNFVKVYTKRNPTVKKYRVEYKTVGKKLNRRWFTSLTEARKFANKKAKEIGVKVTNVQEA